MMKGYVSLTVNVDHSRQIVKKYFLFCFVIQANLYFLSFKGII